MSVPVATRRGGAAVATHPSVLWSCAPVELRARSEPVFRTRTASSLAAPGQRGGECSSRVHARTFRRAGVLVVILRVRECIIRVVSVASDGGGVAKASVVEDPGRVSRCSAHLLYGLDVRPLALVATTVTRTMSWFAANTCGHRQRDVSAGVHHRSVCVWIWMVQRWYGATHTRATTRVQAG